jgi:hypothetical protein
MEDRMWTERNIHSFGGMRSVLLFLASFALLTCVKYGLAAGNQNDESPDRKVEVIDGLKSGFR